jgi:antitoxin MazE6
LTYNQPVKTTITLRDDIVYKAERAASKMGISRNQLFAKAISEFLARRGFTNRRQFSKITEWLNEIYSREPSKLDPVLKRLQAESLKAVDWE